MHFIKEYWWLIFIIFPIGVLVNTIQNLAKISYKDYLSSKKQSSDSLKDDINNQDNHQDTPPTP